VAKPGLKIGRRENLLSYSESRLSCKSSPFVVRAMNSKAKLAIEESRKHDSRHFRCN
jgi:hypothetical protein